MTRDEWLDRFYDAREVVKAYLSRWHHVRRGVMAQDVEKMLTEPQGTRATVFPTISNLHAWILDVEMCVGAVGSAKNVMFAGLFRGKRTWADIAKQHHLSEYDVAAIFRAAVIQFTDALRAKGVTIRKSEAENEANTS